MTYNTNNTIVIAISKTGFTAENVFLPKCKFNLEDVGKDWIYALTNGTCYKYESFVDWEKLTNGFSFVLYNQHKNDCFGNFIKHINTLKKYVLIWRHKSGNNCPDCASLQNNKKIEKLIDCIPFNHDGTTPIEKFMGSISTSGADYSIEFARLIEESLKKDTPHLIALSILCQGYLAAHWDEIDNGKKESLSELKLDSLPDKMKVNAQRNKNKTKGRGWWQPAFNNDDLGKDVLKDTGLGMELTSLGKACKDSTAIEALFKEIKGLNGKSFCDPDKVIAAYKCIRKLL